MLVLSLETTTRAGSVALVEDDTVTAERSGDASRTHAERLPRELLAVLEERGLRTADIDVFAVAAGPGSFTGLRIGIATIQGLALVHRRRVAAVSALDAIVHATGGHLPAGSLIGVWMDAQRRDVFSALYRVSARPVFDRERAMEIDPPGVGRPSDVIARWRAMTDAPIVFAGDGAILHAAAIRASFAGADVLAPPALAGAVGRLAIAQERAGLTVDPGAVRPLYIRRPDAELERERKMPAAKP